MNYDVKLTIHEEWLCSSERKYQFNFDNIENGIFYFDSSYI